MAQIEDAEFTGGGVIAMLRELSAALDSTSLAFADVKGGVGIHHEGAMYVIDESGVALLGDPTPEVRMIYHLATGAGSRIMVRRDDGAYHEVPIEDALAAVEALSQK